MPPPLAPNDCSLPRSPNVIADALNTLPDWVADGTAPNATQQIIEFGILSSKFFNAIDELRALFGKQVLKRSSGQHSNDFVGKIAFVGCQNEFPEKVALWP